MMGDTYIRRFQPGSELQILFVQSDHRTNVAVVDKVSRDGETGTGIHNVFNSEDKAVDIHSCEDSTGMACIDGRGASVGASAG